MNNASSSTQSNLIVVQQQTSQSAMETPLPLLNQDTEEGHITHEINHLKSNSKPTAPMDISLSMQLRRDSIEQQQ